jgi:hypothetical protein
VTLHWHWKSMFVSISHIHVHGRDICVGGGILKSVLKKYGVLGCELGSSGSG